MSFNNTSEIKERQLFPGVNAKLVHTENLTLAYVNLEKDAVVPLHSHVHEQVINILEGVFDMTIDGITKRVGPGYVGIVKSNVMHGVVVIESGRILDIFSPVREDLK